MWLTGSNPIRFIPMMVTRMVLSLKKAASSRQPYLDLVVQTELPTDLQGTSPHAVDDIQLSVLESEQV